ncbi:hypothetical protein ACFO0M_15425 [Micromonospora mangrovi]|uniref:Thiopeptide-type bacteriocin biosynthesis domain-containing protein n=2 Tax=Micromonospora TaxID=1873 RepID=A0AAU7MCG3_9ACTN
MLNLGPGTAVRITDHSAQPRELLRELAEPIRRLKSSQQLPVVHVRRGWLHGSHLLVTARPYADREADLTTLAAEAGALAAARPTPTPDEASYLRRASDLARWENVRQELSPVHPHGHVEVVPHQPRPANAPALALAADQILGRFLEPMLASAALRDDEILPHLAAVLAMLARTHPRGISAGVLPYRSHVEGVSSATGNHTDLRARYAQRYPHDEDVFRTALTGEPSPALRAWEAAFLYAWGVAEGLTCAGSVTDRAIQEAIGPTPLPLGTPVRSDFIGEILQTGLVADPSYRHVAHRVVLNVLYWSLTCFGITPLQRYYLCYGLSEATDQITGETATQRLHRFARELKGQS